MIKTRLTGFKTYNFVLSIIQISLNLMSCCPTWGYFALIGIVPRKYKTIGGPMRFPSQSRYNNIHLNVRSFEFTTDDLSFKSDLAKHDL